MKSFKNLLRSFTTLAIILALAVSFVFSFTQKTEALSGSDFQAGHIVDDSLFFSGYNLSVDEIQTFLNAKVPTCDTWGTKRYNSSMTRAQYGASKGYYAPYTCLKDYRTDTVAKSSESGLCNGYPAANQSAAQIIAGVAQSCNVSPRVLIVLLQKEQGLVTDEWPWSSQYRSATGFGCPDSAPCDAQYYGFFNQVYNAARQFKRYAQSSSYNYLPNRNNYIQYNPNTNCGGSSVYIQNQATAGLYNYTPYQPNQAALNNLYGSGDSCSAYGNRNFWRYYNDWFGSTFDPFDNVNIRLTSPLTVTPGTSGTLYQNQTYTVSFGITNSASYPITIGTPMVAVRGPQMQNLDVPGTSVTIPANSTYTYSKQWNTPYTGWHQFSIVLYKPELGFSYTAPAGSPTSTVRNTWINVQTNPSISSNLTLNPVQPAAGQNYTASFNVRNSTSSPVDIGYPFIIVRGPHGENRDVPIGSRVTVAANSTYTYSKQWVVTEPGTHTFTIAFWHPETGSITTTSPGNDNGIARSITVTVKDNPTLTGSLTLPTEIIAGVPYTASFQVANRASSSFNLGSPLIAVRGPHNENRDVPSDNNITIAAGSTYTYSKQWITPDPGWHQFSIVTYRSDLGGFRYDYPVADSGSVIRNIWVNVKPSLRIKTSLSLSPSQPVVNQSYTATFTIRNDSSQDKDIGYPFIIVRGPHGENRDVPIGSRVTVAANSTYTYSKQWVVTEPGTHTFTIAFWHPETGSITTTSPPADTGVATSLTAQAVSP